MHLPTAPKKRHNNRWLTGLLAVAAVVTSRLNLLPANVSPLGPFGFFGSPLLYGISIIAFDLLFGGLYKNAWITYLGFAAYPLFGALGKRFPERRWLLLPLASCSFFIVSNFGSWYFWYPRTLDGLQLCYALAVPFYARTLIGDLGFGYGYLLLEKRLSARGEAAVSASISMQAR